MPLAEKTESPDQGQGHETGQQWQHLKMLEAATVHTIYENCKNEKVTGKVKFPEGHI